MTALASLVTQLRAIREESLDEALVDTVRRRIFDTLGAAAIGLATFEGRILRAVHDRLQPNGGDPDWQSRCRLLVAATRATEIDDIDIRSCTTVGSVIVPVAMTLAAHESRSRYEPANDSCLMAAIVAGYEAMVRLGRAIDGAALLYRGVWPTQVTAAFASAATVAHYLRLDSGKFSNALGIALSRSAPLPRGALAQTGYRQFALGEAAVDGWLAAYAADAGLEASGDSFGAFAAAIGVEPDLAILGDGDVEAKIKDVDVKCFPSSRQAIASIEAFRKLLPLSSTEVVGIDVRVPAAYRDMVDRPELPRTRIESMIGVQYPMALAATDSPALDDALRARPPVSPEIEGWMAKIRVYADDELTDAFPASWGSRVAVHLKSGDEPSVDVRDPLGSAANPLDWPELEEKLERILAAGGLAVVTGAIAELHERCRSLGSNEPNADPAMLLNRAATLGDALSRTGDCRAR